MIETAFAGKGSDHLQLIKFWPSRAPGKGVCGGTIFFWLRLTTAIAQCSRLLRALFMRPSSLGGGRILHRTLSVRLSVCLSVCPSVPLALPSVTSFRQPLALRMYFSARTEGRISYGHLGRTNSCFIACLFLSHSRVYSISVYFTSRGSMAPRHFLFRRL